MPNISRGDVVLLPIAFVNQQDIDRIIGTFSPQLMDELENCVRAALAMR